MIFIKKIKEWFEDHQRKVFQTLAHLVFATLASISAAAAGQQLASETTSHNGAINLFWTIMIVWGVLVAASQSND